MAIQPVTCPHCQGLSKVDDSGGHESFRCPHCQGTLSLFPALQNKAKTVEYRGTNIRVRELSREEKNTRRRIRNLVLSIGCIAALIITAVLLINAG
jgi:transposase-like protein